MAARIPGARLVELPGEDHLPWLSDSDAILGEIEEFMTGVRHAVEPDRVLATVLFTDIVGATEKAAALGDRRWRDLLDGHNGVVRRELARVPGARRSLNRHTLSAKTCGPRLSAQRTYNTCSNDKVAEAALVSLGGAFAKIVAVAAARRGLPQGRFVAELVRDFERHAGTCLWAQAEQAMRGADQPVLVGLYVVLAHGLLEQHVTRHGRQQCPSDDPQRSRRGDLRPGQQRGRRRRGIPLPPSTRTRQELDRPGVLRTD